jgi:hypothetical protein
LLEADGSHHVSQLTRAAHTDLISRKRIEKQLKSYRAYANDLSAITMTIEEQEDQVEFTKSLASASKMIKKSRIRGQVEAVDEYNDAMAEVSDDRAELDDALSSGRVWSDESSIESELAQMFGDQDDESTPPPQSPALFQLPQLPLAPTDAPRTSASEMKNVLQSVTL